MDCSRRRVLECIACANERCNAIDTLCRNHVHNKLTESPETCTLSRCRRRTLYQKPIRPIRQSTVRLKGKGHILRPRRTIPVVDFLSVSFRFHSDPPQSGPTKSEASPLHPSPNQVLFQDRKFMYGLFLCNFSSQHLIENSSQIRDSEYTHVQF